MKKPCLVDYQLLGLKEKAGATDHPRGGQRGDSPSVWGQYETPHQLALLPPSFTDTLHRGYIKNRNGVEPAVLVAAGYCWKVSFTKRILVSLRWHSVKIVHRPCCIEFTRSFGPRGFLFGSTSILYALRRNNPALDHVDFRRSHERKLNFKKGR